MDLARFSELIKAIPFSRDHVEVISPFDGYEKRAKCAVVEGLHRIITLSLRCFNGWTKTLLSRSEKEAVSFIQARDPYIESLLIALHGRK